MPVQFPLSLVIGRDKTHQPAGHSLSKLSNIGQLFCLPIFLQVEMGMVKN